MGMSKSDSNNTNRLGELIRFHRLLNKMTQKDLAEKCGLNESTIRNYELGNRCPDEETLLKVADALQINYYTLAEPTPENPAGALHMLFDLEVIYGLVPEVIDGKLCLTFEESVKHSFPDNRQKIQTLKSLIEEWHLVRKKWKENDIDFLKYFAWTSKYPEHIRPTLGSDKKNATLKLNKDSEEFKIWMSEWK